MSSDHGVPELDFDVIKAAIRRLVEQEDCSYQEFCRKAGVTHAELSRAMELGSDGFPETFQVLLRVSMALGISSNALLAGKLDDETLGLAERIWLSTKQLLWEFVYKMELVAEEGRKFERFVREYLRRPTTATAGAKFRKGAPRTLKDMAELYGRFRGRVGN